MWGSGCTIPLLRCGGFYPYTTAFSDLRLLRLQPVDGAYGRSAGVYGPYGGAGSAPATTHAPAPAARRPLRAVRRAWRRTGVPSHRHLRGDAPGSNPWKLGLHRRPARGRLGETIRYTNRQSGRRRARSGREGSAVTRRGSGRPRRRRCDSGNVYAGKDSNAYRRQDGTWRNTITAVGRTPTGSRRAANAERSVGARTHVRPRWTAAPRINSIAIQPHAAGTQRTNDYSNYRSGQLSQPEHGRAIEAAAARAGAAAPRAGGGRR